MPCASFLIPYNSIGRAACNLIHACNLILRLSIISDFFEETMELDSPDMYPRTLEEIKAETEADPTLSVLCAFVAHGWPCDKSQVPTALLHYYPLRDELAVDHGVLYKSHKVLIPAKLQSTILKTLHHGHQGGESMIYRAREVMYWSVMQAGTFKMVSNVHCVLAMVSTPKGTDVVS